MGAGNVNLDFHGAGIELRSSTGNPNTCIINGGGADRAFLFDNGEDRDAQVFGFRIRNCVGSAVRCEYSSPTFRNCIFDGNTANDGGAVYLVGSAPLFDSHCVFYNNGGSATVDGGAVYAEGSDAEFLNCYFYYQTQGNSADFGGALHAVSCPDMSLTNCYFNYNTATTDGGAVYIDNHCNPSFANCSFEDNSAAGDGGACFIDYSSDPTFSGCTFTENIADQRGGAIRLDSGAAATFDDCRFDDCTANFGGGAVFTSDASADVTDSIFAYNVAGTQGGAMRYRDGATGVISGCIFGGNSALWNGGAITSTGCTLTISDTSFCSNTATRGCDEGGSQGGAINNEALSVLEIDTCDFKDNTAQGPGGAIANTTGSTLTIVSTMEHWSDCAPSPILTSHFWNNVAACDPGGGAIYNSAASADVDACYFELNSTPDRGGAIRYVDGATGTVGSSTFFFNLSGLGGGAMFATGGTLDVDACVFTLNESTGGRGGALRYADGATGTVIGSEFTTNVADLEGGAIVVSHDQVNVDTCAFVENTAGTYGGALGFRDSSSADVNACSFEYNSASWNAGAISVRDSSTVTVRGSDFLENSVTRDCPDGGSTGGAISAIASDLTVADNCTFQQNYTVCGAGGAIYSEDATTVLEISECEFESNYAYDDGSPGNPGNGGAIASFDGPIAVSGCDFIGNTASEAGAGLLTDGGDATVTGSTFTDNIADFGGGGLFSRDSSTVTVEDSTFTHNWATGTPSFGGAIYIELGTLSLARCGFYEWNEAVTAGGALYTRGAAVSAEDCDFGRDLVGNTAGSGGGACHEAAGPDSAKYKWCRFIGNIASTGGGGGVALVDHNAMLHNCVFIGNESFATGGAIDAFAMINTSLELANCVFCGNTTDVAGGALRVSNNAAITTGRIANSTFARNEATNSLGQGGGVWIGGAGASNVGIDNSIFWENQDAAGNVYTAQIFHAGPPSGYTLGYSCFTPPACPPPPVPPGCICADPAFVNPAGCDDLHLLGTSPCIDAADDTCGHPGTIDPNDATDLDNDGDRGERPPLDLDGIRRFTDRPGTPDTGVPDPPNYPQVADMGAYEFGLLGDLDGDCDVDLSDLGELLANYCIPPSPEGYGVGYDGGDLDLDGHVELDDLAALLAHYGETCP
jgi:predicted outer membrane repeat protein